MDKRTPDDVVLLWVHRKNVAAVQNRIGYVQVPRADAPALVDAGVAVNVAAAIATSTPLPYLEGAEPVGLPRRVPSAGAASS